MEPKTEKKPTYYEFFNLPNFEPDLNKIKKAYRSMALKWHPDRHTEDKKHAEHMMGQVNEVYQTLTKDKFRYDYYLRGKLGTSHSKTNSQRRYNKSSFKNPFNESTLGVAGEDIEPGDAIILWPDGKYYKVQR